MDHAYQRELVRRVLAHVEHRTTDTDGEPTRLPASAYADPQLDLFRRVPVAVGHLSQIPEPGDFFTHDLAGVPLIVTRTAEGVAAMVNICRHRGTRVESEPCGRRDTFACPYHGWTYARDGKLVGLPHRKQFGAVGPRDLVRVPIAELDGLLFVQLDGSFDPTFLGPLADDLAGFGIASGHVYAQQTWTRALSWKLGIDIFLETYHLRTTHATSIYPIFYDNLGLVDRVGRHLRLVIPKRSIETNADGELRRHANLLYLIFPNTLVLVEPDHAALVHVWPAGPDRAVLHTYMIVPEPPRTDKARGYWDANRDILYNAVGEDLAMGESIQRGLPHNTDVVFGAFEHALAHFHDQLRKEARAPGVEVGGRGAK